MRFSLFFMCMLGTVSLSCRRTETCAPSIAAVAKAPQPLPVEVVTMNGGIAPGIVHLADERSKPFAEMIGSFRDAGIVCVQEVWRDEDRDRVIKALDLPKEQVYAFDTAGHNERRGVDVCTPKRVKKLEACVRENCANASPEDVHLCAQEQCHLELGMTFMEPPTCGNCLAAMAGHTIDETLARCTGPVGASRLYGGRNGVILASKWPLKNREAKELPASGANRVVLFATVTVPNAGDIEVACTHLSSSQDAPPNQSDFIDWEEEQTAQLKIVSDTLASRAVGRPSILVGDLNVGPKLAPNISSVGRDVWKLALELGFQDSASEAIPAFCSICDGNTLRASHDSTLIDHVLRRQSTGNIALVPNGAWQVACTPVPITKADGTTTLSNLSDHCGIRAAFKVEVSAPQ